MKEKEFVQKLQNDLLSFAAKTIYKSRVEELISKMRAIKKPDYPQDNIDLAEKMLTSITDEKNGKTQLCEAFNTAVMQMSQEQWKSFCAAGMKLFSRYVDDAFIEQLEQPSRFNIEDLLSPIFESAPAPQAAAAVGDTKATKPKPKTKAKTPKKTPPPDFGEFGDLDTINDLL